MHATATPVNLDAVADAMSANVGGLPVSHDAIDAEFAFYAKEAARLLLAITSGDERDAIEQAKRLATCTEDRAAIREHLVRANALHIACVRRQSAPITFKRIDGAWVFSPSGEQRWTISGIEVGNGVALAWAIFDAASKGELHRLSACSFAGGSNVNCAGSRKALGRFAEWAERRSLMRLASEVRRISIRNDGRVGWDSQARFDLE